MVHECETCKYTELNGCDYPCHCCAVVYKNTGFNDMWERGGCDFCNSKTYMPDGIGSLSMSGNELIVTDEYDNERFFQIKFCPECGREL